MYGFLVSWAAVASNLLIAGMFLARVVSPRRAQSLGWAGTAMAIPLAAASVIAAATGRDGWDVALPAVFVGFAVIEVVVDGLGGGSAKKTRWLWPYLGAFYLAQWALVGAAFRVGTRAGTGVLATYFVCLAATAYSYRRVGHGDPDDAGESRRRSPRRREGSGRAAAR